MTDIATSGATIVALALSHLWQSVAVAAVLAVILVLGRRLSGSARYGLACAAMAASILLPLAMFAPGAGARAVLLDMLKAPVTVAPAKPKAEASVSPEPASTPDFGLGVAQAAVDVARNQVDHAKDATSSPEARLGLGFAQFALDAARSGASGDAPADPAAARRWGKPVVSQADARPAKPAFHFDFPKLPDLTAPFLIVWLAGTLTLLVRVGCDVAAAERLVARARTIPLPLDLARRLGRVRLAISADANGPMAAGLFRPTVILPESAVERIGSSGMAALLEHELAHIERRDVLAALAQRIAVALLWWSPAMYWISRRIDEERESACDETAVERTGDARAFARTLTSQAESQLWASTPRLVVGAIGRRSQFGRRIRRLVDMAKSGGVPAHYSGRLAFTGLALAIALAAFLTPKLAEADVPKSAPPLDSTLKGKPLPLLPDGKPAPATPDSIEHADRLDGRRADDADDNADNIDDLGDSLSDLLDQVSDQVQRSLDDAQPGMEKDAAALGVQLAALGVEIGAAVSQQVATDMPAILADVRAQLKEQGIDIDDLDELNNLSDADRERLRADMERLRERMKREFGPEFRAKLQRDMERARRDIERARQEVEREKDRGHFQADASEARRQAMLTAQAAMAKAAAEIRDARARGDFDFKFDFKDGLDGRPHGYRVDIGLASDSPERQLMEAAEAGDLSRVRELIKSGADVNRGFAGDGSALIVAARHGRIDVVRALLDAGADADKSVRGDGNALIAAVSAGEVDVARLLVQRGADVDSYVPGDETPLISAARWGELGAVKLLVEHGAKVNLAYRVYGRTRSALGIAQSHGYGDVAAYLRAHGAIADPTPAN
ncbi:MAG: hypothetical protein GC155_03575 [Alphaproteobacteria bacterium]|nr:hypothetical protein [Alphaproteobacteria bacterium]